MILIKSKKEIDYIRESCQIVAETLQLVKRYAKPGVSTLELDKIAEDWIRSNDGIPAFKGFKQYGIMDFPGTICASIDEVVVHGIPSNRVLEEGQIFFEVSIIFSLERVNEQLPYSRFLSLFINYFHHLSPFSVE